MKSFTLSTIAALAAFLPATLAQTHTDCFPLNTTGCPDMQALGGNATFLFNKTGIADTNDKVWRKQNNGEVGWDEKGGATFTVKRSGDAPMVQSKFYMLFGRLEVVLKAASGKGIVSSAILQSEALDEIDWEFLGSNTTHVLTNCNYFFPQRKCHDANRIQISVKATPPPSTEERTTQSAPHPRMSSTTTPLTGPRTVSSGG
jgi:hypothetical protein